MSVMGEARRETGGTFEARQREVDRAVEAMVRAGAREGRVEDAICVLLGHLIRVLAACHPAAMRAELAASIIEGLPESVEECRARTEARLAAMPAGRA